MGIWSLQKRNSVNGFLNGTMYISRELDQALWVYGHATIDYFDIEK